MCVHSLFEDFRIVSYVNFWFMRILLLGLGIGFAPSAGLAQPSRGLPAQTRVPDIFGSSGGVGSGVIDNATSAEAFASIVKDVGFGAARIPLLWARIESPKNVDNWVRTDRVIDLLTTPGSSVKTIILGVGVGGTNSLYGDPDLSPFYNEGAVAGLSNFLVRAAKHLIDKYPGVNFVWEIGNEPNAGRIVDEDGNPVSAGGWNSPAPKFDGVRSVTQYPTMVFQVSNFLRANYPRGNSPGIIAVAAGNGPNAYPDTSALRNESMRDYVTYCLRYTGDPAGRILRAGGWLDGISYHPYPQTKSTAPESYLYSLDRDFKNKIAGVINVPAGNNPLGQSNRCFPVITEFGWTAPFALGDSGKEAMKDQAIFNVRGFLHSLRTSSRLTSYYSTMDENTNPSGHGLTSSVSTGNRRKSTYYAVKSLFSELNGYHSPSAFSLNTNPDNPQFCAIKLKNDAGAIKLVVWPQSMTVAADFYISVPSGINSIVGRRVPVAYGDTSVSQATYSKTPAATKIKVRAGMGIPVILSSPSFTTANEASINVTLNP
jgi:hypothetical protein